VNAPRKRLAVPIVLFCLLTVLLIVAGVGYYVQTDRQIKTAAAEKLAAVADLKVKLISGWREERLRDAAVLSTAPISCQRIVPYLETNPETAGSDPEIEAEIKDWMNSIVAAKKFVGGILLDAAGRIRIVLGPGEPVIGSQIRQDLSLVIPSSRALLSDFRTMPSSDNIYLDLFAPVPRRNPSGRTDGVGVFVFEIDPTEFLYPLLEKWPEPSRTAETNLVRREGQDILHLNNLRDRPDSALEFRVPLSSDTPAAQAIRGKPNPVEGHDYRGRPVLAWVSPIPETPWLLVAKEDLDEIREPLIARVSSFSGMIVVLWFGFGIMILFWIKRREAVYFKNRYETEHERLALIQHFEYLHKYANDIVLLTDRNHHVIEVNDRALATYGYTREEMERLYIPDLRPPQTRGDFARQLDEAEKSGSLIFETLHQKKTGEVFPVEVSLRLLDIGGARYYQAIIRDISERKRAEARTLAALREKEVLLREIHHRVKNNMQVISSLLRLQSSRFSDAAVREAFQESQGRIKSMALVHEKLYGTKDLTRIDFADYVKSLTSSIFAFNQESERIALRLDLEKTFLDINAAVPCGLIVNELVLNAFKHAFPNNRPGKITVELRENENDMIRLTVRDDGIGLAEGIKPEQSESLGFQIISLLAGQLEGHLDVRREYGTSVSLFFKAPVYADRI